jgi:hypothetical protein
MNKGSRLGGFEMSTYTPLPAPQSAIDFLGNAVLDRAENVARESGMANTSRALAYGNAAERIVAEADKAAADLITHKMPKKIQGITRGTSIRARDYVKRHSGRKYP